MAENRAVGHLNAAAVREQEREFERGCAAIAAYAHREGHVDVPSEWCDDAGFPLGTWVAQQRLRRLEDRLDQQRCATLENVDGWTWDPPRT